MDIDSRWINTGSYYTVKVHNLYNNVMAVLCKCDDLSQFQYFFFFFLTAISRGEGDGAYLSCIRAKEGYTTVGPSCGKCLAHCTSALLWRCAGTSVTSTSSNSSSMVMENTAAASKNTSYANSRANGRGSLEANIILRDTVTSPIDLFTRGNKEN